MKYYVVKWTIRDGENEYDEQVLVKLDYKPDYEDTGLFEKVLYSMYGWKPEWQEELGYYELEHDYRAFELLSIMELPRARAKIAKEANLIFELELQEVGE